MAGNPKTLIVLEGEWYFEFFFDDEEPKYWRVRDHPEASGWFLVEEFEEGWYNGEFYDSYENAGAENLQGLLKRLIDEPERTLEGLFGEKFQIKEVKVEKIEEEE